jgi:DNA-binding response OmpR family regulator
MERVLWALPLSAIFADSWRVTSGNGGVIIMSALVVTDPFSNKMPIQAQMSAAGFNAESVVYVESAKALMDALLTSSCDLIVTEYAVANMDIWRISTLINSMRFSPQVRPIFLIKETCEIDIPVLLAKEYGFTVVPLENLAGMLTVVNDPANRQQFGGCRHTVLIIEDDKDASLTACHALKGLYEVDIAYDGLSGYALWEAKHHDLVLLDLMLPKLSGEDILSKMMVINKNQSVIIVSALDKPKMQNKLLLNGASEYLCKPFSMDALKTLCQKLLNKSKLLHQAHFAESKLNAIRNLVWLLDYALSQNDADRLKQIMAALKGLLPNNLTEDEKISLIAREF